MDEVVCRGFVSRNHGGTINYLHSGRTRTQVRASIPVWKTEYVQLPPTMDGSASSLVYFRVTTTKLPATPHYLNHHSQAPSTITPHYLNHHSHRPLHTTSTMTHIHTSSSITHLHTTSTITHNTCSTLPQLSLTPDYLNDHSRHTTPSITHSTLPQPSLTPHYPIHNSLRTT